ncbi:MAG TPA: hypothetical protein DIC31_01210 [Rhizobiales bacterium]|nr:hypothetical protein [Hyphomicrobiales bacterium]
MREAPQHEVATLGPYRLLGDHGKGESKCRWPITVGARLDLVQPRSLELVQGRIPLFLVMPAKAGIQ